jgi:hypothetical protein
MANKLFTVEEIEEMKRIAVATFKEWRIACVRLAAALEIMKIAASDGRKPKGKPLPLNTVQQGR